MSEENEKMFNVPVELFQLDKLVLNAGKNCKVWFTIVDGRGEKTETFKGFMEPSYQCVQAMQNKLNELKPFLCKLRHLPENEHSNVQVKGVIWKGKGKTEAFSILGTQTTDSEKNMVLDSAVEHIGVEKYSFESDIRGIIIELETFANGYIFDGRKPEVKMGLKPNDDIEDTKEV